MSKDSKYNKVKKLTKRSLVDLKIAKGQRDYNRVIILSDYRSGSNFLMNLLKDHPNFVCFSELFYVHEIFWSSLIYKPLKSSSKLLNERKENPISFLNKYAFNRKYPSYVKAVAFKLMYHDLYSSKTVDLKDIIKNTENLFVIHLTRQNLLKRLVSAHITKATETAVAVNKENWENKLSQLKKFNFTKEYCEKEFKYKTNLKEDINKTLLELNVNHLNIVYEDLVKSPETILQNIVNSIQIEYFELNTKQIKQNTKKLADTIENYDEIKNEFKDSPFYSFFE